MNEPTINNLGQRLNRLERENRRMKLAGMLVLELNKERRE